MVPQKQTKGGVFLFRDHSDAHRAASLSDFQRALVSRLGCTRMNSRPGRSLEGRITVMPYDITTEPQAAALSDPVVFPPWRTDWNLRDRSLRSSKTHALRGYSIRSLVVRAWGAPAPGRRSGSPSTLKVGQSTAGRGLTVSDVDPPKFPCFCRSDSGGNNGAGPAECSRAQDHTFGSSVASAYQRPGVAPKPGASQGQRGWVSQPGNQNVAD